MLTVPTPVHPTQAVSILDSAAQTGTEELLDLDDGRIPQSWNLDVIRRGPGLVNDRLEGRATDSGAELWKEITLAPGSEMLELSHDGNLEDSYWGHITQAFFILRSGERISLTNMRATANWGDANVIAMLWGKKKREETQYSRMSGTFSFEWRITQDEIIGSVKDYYSGQVLQSAQYRTPAGFRLSDIGKVGFRAYQTTGQSPAWVDNLFVNVSEQHQSLTESTGEFRGPIRLHDVPARVRLMEAVNLSFQVANNVRDYRYRLEIPGEWKAGLRHMTDRWSDWKQGRGESISYSDFFEEGEYTFAVEYVLDDGSRAVFEHVFEVFWEYPEIIQESLTIDLSSLPRSASSKERMAFASRELNEACSYWHDRFEYSFSRLRNEPNPLAFAKIFSLMSQEGLSAIYNLELDSFSSYIQASGSSGAGSSAYVLGAKSILSAAQIYSLIKEGHDALVLVMRNKEANKAAAMSILTCNLAADLGSRSNR